MATASSCSELENTGWLTQIDSDEHILADTLSEFGLLSLIFFSRLNLFVMLFLFINEILPFLSQMTLCNR